MAIYPKPTEFLELELLNHTCLEVVTAGATIDITVTSALLTAGAIVVSMEVPATATTKILVATAIRAALNADSEIPTFFTIGGATDKIILTAVDDAADATLTVIITDGDTSNIVMASSVDTVAGVLGVKQVETATVSVGSDADGTIAVTVTGAPLDTTSVVDVVVATGDTADEVATAIRAALTLDASVAAHYVVSGATDKVILTAILAVANDTTLAITISDADSTTCAISGSANTEAGVLGVLQVETGTVVVTEATSYIFDIGRPITKAIAKIKAMTTGADNPTGLLVTIATVEDTSCKITVGATAFATGDVINVIAW